MKIKTFVGIDPGVDDLIYATNGDTKTTIRDNGQTKLKTTTFRYSRMQRRFETKSRKYANIIEKNKKKTIVNGKTVKELEAELSGTNFNSCILSNVKNNILLKNRVNNELFDYYEKHIHRQLKWFGHINRERSEANMINNFKNKFGSPKDVLILMGDWSKHREGELGESTQKNMRYKEPTKGKGFRQLFKRNGYKLCLVDEYNTSQKMYGKGDAMEKFKYNKGTLVHGLLRNKLTAGIPGIKSEIMNRDLNGSLNIRMKGILQFYDLPELSYLSRLKSDNKTEKVSAIKIIPKTSIKMKIIKKQVTG
jgi:hypothetical protein